MKMKKKKLIIYSSMILGVICAAGIVYAAFTDKADVLGATFSVGSADMKFMEDLSGSPTLENLTDQLTGPSFVNISPNWQEDYLLKLVNNGTTRLKIFSNADYETINDPEDLRQDIVVEILEWYDTNGNGVVDVEEEGIARGKKTIVKWKTEGIAIGEFSPGEVKALILRFSTESLSETKQGATGVIDFVFESLETQ